jgi:squamous cell carcinoma antigen recognized by T-cells 3
MDALAEAAARQRPQTILRQHDQSSNSTTTQSGSSRSTIDAIMPDAPPAPDSYDFSSLPHSVREKLASCVKRVADNPFDIAAHTELVQTLHQEFCRHVEAGKDAHSFEPVNALRQARLAMDKIFPVGEDLWIGWLTDENLLSRSIDDHINVMDLHLKSVLDEPSSAQLWRRYGDYMYYLWSASNSPESGWSESDRAIGKEVFQWEPMMDVWEQGIARTQLHLNDSNLVWDRYMEILVNDLSRESPPQKIANIREKFMERLTARAHATWDQTSQAFSQFLSKYDQDAYEETMSLASQRSANVKKTFSMRESFEFKIQQAQERCDKDSEWAVYTEYLAWEIRMKGIFSKDLINGLYERATTRFSTDANLWVEYVEFLIESPVKDIPMLSVLERATRHCPWSGDLWSHRILAMESEGKSFEEVEEVKHKATASGLVDINGLEDLMKVYIAWCGYLRRRAFTSAASEDERDVAEMGIRSSIEHVMQAGQKKYGNEFKGDPQYRLERIHIKFQYQRNGIESCRALWNDLIPRVGDSYDFWYRYYIWAMLVWSKLIHTSEGASAVPKDATQVLEMALQRIDTMDWPEQLLPMYLNHCEQHESVQVYRKALIEVRRATKRIEERREKEKVAQAVPQSEQTGKRKRNDESVADEQQTKKLKGEEDVESMAVAVADSAAQPKRDRENTTIVVRDLPNDVTQTKVRQFFRDCGTVNDVHLYKEGGKQVAMVEFETKEDALFAQSKVTKPFEGQTISIEFSTGSTMWVTNYPPSADEKYIRNLFGKVSSTQLDILRQHTNDHLVRRGR